MANASYVVVARHPVTLPNGRMVAPGETVDTGDDVSDLVDAGQLVKAKSTTAAKGGDSK